VDTTVALQAGNPNFAHTVGSQVLLRRFFKTYLGVRFTDGKPSVSGPVGSARVAHRSPVRLGARGETTLRY
jgi:hypothetical protein